MEKKKTGGFLLGIILIIIGSIILINNEKNNVKNIKTVDELKKVAIDVSSEKVNKENEGKLVAISGKLNVDNQTVADYVFNVTAKTAKLERIVEIYQWEETENEENDKTTYSYDKVWSNNIIDSSKFNDTTHSNPSSKKYEDASYLAESATVGAFSLSTYQKDSLAATKEMTLEGVNEIYLPKDYYISGKYITSYKKDATPDIGAVRISFKYNDYETVSILAMQYGNSFENYTSKVGKSVNRVFNGKLNAEQMINKIENENNTMKWIMRAIGILLVMFGYSALFTLVYKLLNYIPILGNFASNAISFVASAIGLIHALIIIIIAWFRYRPVISLILIALIVSLIIFIRNKKNKDSLTQATKEETKIESKEENAEEKK